MAGAAVRDVIHIINPLWDPDGGSDWRAVEMYEALRVERSVRLWSRFHPARVFVERYPVELIRPWLGHWPVGGTFIFIGAYFRVEHWFKAAFPPRTILIYNTHQPDRLSKVLARLEAWHRTPVEIVYAAPTLRSARPGDREPHRHCQIPARRGARAPPETIHGPPAVARHRDQASSRRSRSLSGARRCRCVAAHPWAGLRFASA